ncbi:MAG: TPM domain-containing protein [Bdellovibrionales bacterium]|nr:TPM domain-containing protein [Bdellovibrionales bacterium]
MRDRAELFSPAARTKIEVQNKTLLRYYKAGIAVETFASAPGLSEQPGGAQQSTTEFNTWLKSRAEKAGRDNVYILVVKNPPYLLVSVGERLRERDVFPRIDRDMLMRLLAGRFQQKSFDKGLLEGAALVRDTLSNRIEGTEIPTYTMLLTQRAAAAQQQQRENSMDPPGSYLHWIGLILVAVFGAWLAFNIYQTLAAKGKSGRPVQDGT